MSLRIRISGRPVLQCLFAALPLVAAGCAAYVTPGSGVKLSTLADADINERLARQPAAAFPARLAVARVQGSGYRSHYNEGYGSGRFSVVTTRDVEKDEQFDRIAKLPMVAGLAPLGRLILPQQLDSVKDLRLAAASLKTDLLLVYSLDTTFRVADHDFGPLKLISLGLLPTEQAHVTTTASAAVFDVRTGFVYGLSEATARESQIASAWTSEEAVEQSQRRAEQQAFEKLVGEFEKTWKQIVEEHSGRRVATGP